MNTKTITTIHEAQRDITSDYRPYDNAIDREVASESTCSACGHVGLGYRGWRRPEKTGPHFWISSSYRAFTVCPSCGHAEEF